MHSSYFHSFKRNWQYRRVWYLSLFTFCSSALMGVAEEPLFSELAMESVYEKKKIASDDSTNFRVTGPTGLKQTLQAAGFEPKTAKDRVTFSLQRAGLSLEYELRAFVEQDLIAMSLRLATAGPDTLNFKSILKLLSATDESKAIWFAYDRDQKQLELRSAISNRDASSHQLKARVQEMATLAIEHRKSWRSQGEQQTANARTISETRRTQTSTAPRDSSSTKTAPSTNKSTELLPPNLPGTWSAELGKDSFAIRIMASANFRMVHVRSGKSSQSIGTMKHFGDQLVLNSNDGTSLSCRYELIAPNKLQLVLGRLPNEINLQFTRAKSN